MTETTVTERATAAHATIKCQFCGTWNKIDASRAADRPKCGKCGKPMLLDRPIALDDESFSRTIAGSEVPVLVDFYADWCGPCKIMAPEVDKLAANYSGRAIIAKLNTDLAQRTSQSFQIRGIPTSIVFVKGKEVFRQTGAVPYAGLATMLSKAGL
jgi:thioredoxin 2